MNVIDEYSSKRRTPADAVQVVRSGDWVELTFGHGIPLSLDRALAARKSELQDVKIRWMLALRPLEVVKADPECESFTFMCWHFSGLDRRYCDQGQVYYIPLLYRNKPRHYRSSLEVDVWDDTAGVTLVFYGRRSVAGITTGARLAAEGTVGERHGRLAIANPRYRLIGDG